MILSRVLIVGGSGFVGTHVAARLSARGIRVVVPTRRRERARHLLPLPTVDVVQIGLGDPDFPAALAGCDAVISLAGVLLRVVNDIRCRAQHPSILWPT